MGPVTHFSPRWWTRRRLLLVAGLGSLVLVLVLLALNARLGAAAEAAVQGLRQAGPWVFFLAMALLPAVGFPMMAFTLSAGVVFGPLLGIGWVIGWSLAAVVGNLLLTYWLASRALRPLVFRLLSWSGLRLPESPAHSAWQMTLIVRLAPGPPFWVQSYLLGVLRVPLIPYLVVSTLVMTGYIVALAWGGEALARGNGRLVFAAVGLLVAVGAVFHWLRRRTTRRRAAVSLSAVPGLIVPAK
jgi:uncharacterized membrane protein YdjX (TVP38/TMEM64 family)